MKFSLARAAVLCAILFGLGCTTGSAFSGTPFGELSTFFGPPRLHLVSIGVSHYEGAPKWAINYTVDDAQSIVQEFKRRGETTYVDLDKTLHTLTGPAATGANICKALDDIAADASAADTFVFFFAGAGWSTDDDYYILPGDYHFPSDSQNSTAIARSLSEHGLSNTVLQSYFRKIRAGHKLVIMDSGPFAPDASGIDELFVDGSVRRRTRVDGDLLLIASDTGSTERPSGGHGTVTEILLKGLAGPADIDENGTFSSRELEAYVYKGAVEYKGATEYEKEFHSVFKFHPITLSRGGDFPLLLTDAALRIQKDIRDTQTALEDLREHESEIAELERKEVENRRIEAWLTSIRETTSPQTKSFVKLSATDYKTISAWFGFGRLKSKPDGQQWLVAYDQALALTPPALDRRKIELNLLRTSDSPAMQRYRSLLKALASFEDEYAKLHGERPPQPLARSGEVAVAGETTSPRTGKDYALLIANSTYRDGLAWKKLTNPRNDVHAIREELIDRYGFEPANVEIKEDLTTEQIDQKIDEYKAKFASPAEDDSQLFVFFAGHGYGDKIDEGLVDGYLVGQDSPRFTRAESGKFVDLGRLLGRLGSLRIKHVFVAFDACFAGDLWKPDLRREIQLSAKLAPDPDLSFIYGRTSGPSADALESYVPTSFLLPHNPKGLMGNLSRVAMTSGDGPVLDAWAKPDGSISSNSPFAEDFLRALRSNGNSDMNKDDILTTKEIEQYTANFKKADRGTFGGKNADGDFVFIYHPKTN